jgi:hypothetical protein
MEMTQLGKRETLRPIRWAGWPDAIVKKIAQNVAQPIFCQHKYCGNYGRWARAITFIRCWQK